MHEAVNEIKLAQLVLAEPRLAVGLEPRFDIVQKSDAVGVAFNALDLQADAVHKLYRAARENEIGYSFVILADTAKCGNYPVKLRNMRDRGIGIAGKLRGLALDGVRAVPIHELHPIAASLAAAHRADERDHVYVVGIVEQRACRLLEFLREDGGASPPLLRADHHSVERAVERADVVVVVIDATEGVTEQDAKIAGIAHERGKGVVIAVNKWDAVEKDDKTIYKHTNRIREVLAYMPYAELVFISAKSGQRLPRLFETIDAVIENQTLRIQTGVLNEILSEAVAMQQPPSDRGKRLKIFYMTQVGVKPPTFVIFVNDKELMHFSYTRYIENKVRDAFGFRGTSLKFIIRERGEKS